MLLTFIEPVFVFSVSNTKYPFHCSWLKSTIHYVPWAMFSKMWCKILLVMVWRPRPWPWETLNHHHLFLIALDHVCKTTLNHSHVVVHNQEGRKRATWQRNLTFGHAMLDPCLTGLRTTFKVLTYLSLSFATLSCTEASARNIDL